MKIFNRQRYLYHMKNNWIFYLLVIVFSISFWIILFNLKFSNPSIPTINIFVSGQLTNQTFEKTIEVNFDNTLAINAVSIDKNNEGYYDKLSLVGLISCEIIILPKSVAENLPLKNYMHQISLDFINTNFTNQDLEFYSLEDNHYGIKIDSTMMNSLKDYYHFSSEDYYLFINDISVDGDNNINNNVLEVIRFLLGD